MSSFPPYDEARPLLRPMPIGSVQLEVRKLGMRAAGAPASAIPVPLVIAAELGTVVVVRSPTSTFALGQAALDEWGMTIAQVHEAAMENMRDRGWQTTTLEHGVILAAEFDLVAAALHRPALFAQLGLDGDPVVLMPSIYEMLVFSSTSVDQQLVAIAAATDMLYATATLGTVVPVVLRNGQWQVFEWPAAVRPAATDLGRHWKQAIYTTQRPILGDYMAASRSALVPGELGIATGADDAHYLMAIVNETTPVAIPETEWVALTPQSSPPLTISWQAFVTLAGDRLRPVNVIPPRHYLTSFPTAEELAPLRAR